MKKSNALFIALTATSVALISAVMMDNIASTTQRSSCPPAMTTPTDPSNTRATETIRQKFKQMGLPLHEGKHWKGTHE
jgi:hypothetical protein